ncbi:4-hydroxy-tetrahydrodipicolinate reductase [Flavobacterium cyanobacteriorum]|uniref:4-hydroxy-tetrahydrodipicolinate reductase n=1 Tax=Flavobacterium cyanobacteriorum TaxID=2022802 RepID=A0A255ZQK2_9FLAO|nr:4-hydroxy-tetrahydrodipicolinate reductase [Flavobacterium cyanobacteriorum]OYQ43699.1 4-hydroxy-tetrahydrodipicolinate reductase [Flavobacterium cyanobacteriorum]
MKIALLGYGKMGKVIERIAHERGHDIVLKKGSKDSFTGLENADVAIDFSIPDAAFGNISACLNSNIPVVSGTTGWLDKYHEAAQLCEEKKGAFIYGSNFSLGVNIFFELNSCLAKMMGRLGQYKVSMEEIHHTQKLDAPSGTAITLANEIIAHSDYSSWAIGNPKEDEIFIDAKRVEGVPGTHTVTYNSPIDSIEIKHTAHSREGFALGAVIAAEWLIGKKGIYSMKDVLGL